LVVANDRPDLDDPEGGDIHAPAGDDEGRQFGQAAATLNLLLFVAADVVAHAARYDSSPGMRTKNEPLLRPNLSEAARIELLGGEGLPLRPSQVSADPFCRAAAPQRPAGPAEPGGDGEHQSARGRGLRLSP